MNNYNAWQTERDDWELYPAFELELVRQGVSKGKRHFSFKQYLGWMIQQGYSKDEAWQTIFDWNEHNCPRIPESELRYLFEYYWAMWYTSEESQNSTQERIGHEHP